MKKRLVSVLTLLALSACFAFANGFKPTAKPEVLPFGTNGSAGTKGTYVLFGDWPQTVKDDDVTVSYDTEEVNGWECYRGSDGFYYVKTEAKLYNSDTYYYEFDNGEAIEEGEYYYFKMEPIKWCVLTDDYQGGILLVAEKILAAKRFNNDYNNYKNSEIRAWLNDDFINCAFSKEAMESIHTVTVDNSAESTGDEYNVYACENTSDKIFLLSFASKCKFDMTGRRKTTDYARATGAYTYKGVYKNYGWFWLRSPVCFNGDSARYVLLGNDNADVNDVRITGTGVVPALSISF